MSQRLYLALSWCSSRREGCFRFLVLIFRSMKTSFMCSLSSSATSLRSASSSSTMMNLSYSTIMSIRSCSSRLDWFFRAFPSRSLGECLVPDGLLESFDFFRGRLGAASSGGSTWMASRNNTIPFRLLRFGSSWMILVSWSPPGRLSLRCLGLGRPVAMP